MGQSVGPLRIGERGNPYRKNIAPAKDLVPRIFSVLIWPDNVYIFPPLTLSEFTAIASWLQVAGLVNSKLAAPLGATVFGSRLKQVRGNDQPVVPCEKSPFSSRFGLNEHPTSGAFKPPSTTVCAK